MMNKKIFIRIVSIIPLLFIVFCLLACGGNKLNGFDKFVKNIYDSELIIAGYNEVNSIYDGDFEIYNKNTNFISPTEVSIDGIDVVLLYEQK